MRKILRLVFCVFLLGVVVSSGVPSGAKVINPSDLVNNAIPKIGYDYVIRSYDVFMKVTKQNTYRIQETLNVTFNQRKHGIYRDIPVVNHVRRSDGSENTICARVKNISCSDTYEVSRVGDNCRIKIGDKDRTIIGPKAYTISYDYVMGNDPLPNEDELYFNIIGTQWKTQISNVTFAIEMPDKFEEEKLGMSYGPYGSEKTDGLFYQIDGNVIHGNLDPDITLNSGEGVTVRLTLPEGYFERADQIPWLAFVGISLAAAAALIGGILWYKFGRDDPVVETVEFYAPDGLNSVELAFAYKGHVDSDDVVSLLVYLAQKGYLKIDQVDKKSFLITKVREYDGTNEAERMFFNGLFAGRTMVKKKDLENSFYKTVNTVKAIVDNRFTRRQIFNANSLNKAWILWLITVVAFTVSLTKPIGENQYSWMLGLGVSAGFGLLTCFAFSSLFRPGYHLAGRIILFLVLAGTEAVVYYILVKDILALESFWYTFSFIMMTVWGGVANFFGAYMSKRTPYGTEILGRILGFRNFLALAEKERLEEMVNENPEYFYEILPYTYVLDLSNKWMEKFESIAVEPPTWYSSYESSMFDMVMFNSFMHSTMSQATSSMTSTPSSSSGGGFSGGGSGGGGGGSW